MSERERMESRKPEEQNLLKNKLLTGSISTSEFLEEVLNLELADPERKNSTKNIAILTDESVSSILERDADTFEFYNLLSLSYFHSGQHAIDKDPNKAKELLQNALVAADKVNSDPGYDQWRMYIKATIAYLDKNIPELESLVAKVTDGNQQVIIKLLNGLKASGDINYARDYFNKA